MDYGDAGDSGRGMMFFDYEKENGTFRDWDDCPKYVKTTLSAILDDEVTIYEGARVKCIADLVISFEERSLLVQKFQEDYKLREITIEESPEIAASVSGTESDVDVNDQLASVDELVLQMLNDVENKQIDNSLLVSCYTNLNKE